MFRFLFFSATLLGLPVCLHAVCPTSLQALINNAPTGTTLTLPPCVFRESIQISKSITLVGSPGTEVRGSDIWTEWTAFASGGVTYYRSTRSVPVPRNHGYNLACPNANQLCGWPEQVFFNLKPLAQVAANTLPKPGQFALNSARQVILCDSPSGHVVEVSVRDRLVGVTASDVTLKGITVRHSMAFLYDGMVIVGVAGTVHRFTVQGCLLLDSHAAALFFAYGTGHKAINNTIIRSGQLGISAYLASNVLISGNTVYASNTERYSTGDEAGAMKLVTVDGFVVQNNLIYGTDAKGIWFDIHSNNNIIRNNIIHHTASAGIMYEISSNASIYGNKIWRANYNARYSGSVFVSSSFNVNVFNNIIAWSGTNGIYLIAQNRPDSPCIKCTRNVSANNNYIFTDTALSPFAGRVMAIGYEQLEYTDGYNWFNSANHIGGVGNHFWFDTAESHDTLGRYYCNSWQHTLASFDATSCESSSVMLGSSDLSYLSVHGIPTSPPAATVSFPTDPKYAPYFPAAPNATTGFKGCFVDNTSRDLPVRAASASNMTVPYCLSLCKARSYTYAGLQWSRECWCGNTFGRYGAAPLAQCNMPCAANSTQMCGGNLRNSIYDVNSAVLRADGDMAGAASQHSFPAWAVACVVVAAVMVGALLVVVVIIVMRGRKPAAQTQFKLIDN